MYFKSDVKDIVNQHIDVVKLSRSWGSIRQKKLETNNYNYISFCDSLLFKNFCNVHNIKYNIHHKQEIVNNSFGEFDNKTNSIKIYYWLHCVWLHELIHAIDFLLNKPKIKNNISYHLSESIAELGAICLLDIMNLKHNIMPVNYGYLSNHFHAYKYYKKSHNKILNRTTNILTFILNYDKQNKTKILL